MTSLLLDTGALIWIANGDPISDDARTALDTAYQSNGKVYVSPASAWEIGRLAARGAIKLSMDAELWFRRVLATPSIHLAPLTPEILIASSGLPGKPPKDTWDRIILATAIENKHTLITRTGKLIRCAQSAGIAVLAC